jgi:hypothetical protein
MKDAHMSTQDTFWTLAEFSPSYGRPGDPVVISTYSEERANLAYQEMVRLNTFSSVGVPSRMSIHPDGPGMWFVVGRR